MIKSSGWFIPALAAILLWGLWGFFQKLATLHISPRNVYVFSTAGTLAAVLAIVLSPDFRLQFNGRGVTLAIVSGLAGAFGAVFFAQAMSRGKASLVITITALYPVVTILLSFFILREEITLRQGVGIILGLIAMTLLSF